MIVFAFAWISNGDGTVSLSTKEVWNNLKYSHVLGFLVKNRMFFIDSMSQRINYSITDATESTSKGILTRIWRWRVAFLVIIVFFISWHKARKCLFRLQKSTSPVFLDLRPIDVYFITRFASRDSGILLNILSLSFTVFQPIIHIKSVKILSYVQLNPSGWFLWRMWVYG